MAMKSMETVSDRESRRLFERYYRSVFFFFANRGFSNEECLDLTQETFLRVYKSRGQVRREEAFPGWIRRIAANLWKNEIRRRSAIKRTAEEVSLEKETEDDETRWAKVDPVGESKDVDPLTDLLAKEEIHVLRQVLCELPPQMRRCIRLRIEQEMKYREIATVMQLSIDTVKSQIHQARQRLKSEMERYRTPDSSREEESHSGQ